jgi:ATP-dependent RNA helicase DOB1
MVYAYFLQMEMNTLKDMVLGKPAPLVSTFRLSYYSILNLMSRAEGQFTAEHVIRNSFHQFQYEKVFAKPLCSFLSLLGHTD